MSDDLPPPPPPPASVPAAADDGPSDRRRRIVWAAIIAVAAVVLAGIVVVLVVDDDSSDSVTTGTDLAVPVATTDPAVTTAPRATDAPATTAASTVAPTEPDATTTEPAVTAATTAPTTEALEPVDARPIAAIDGNGDAVVLPTGGPPAVVLYDGIDPDDPPPEEGGTTAVDGVAVMSDLSLAFVGDCCEPVPGVLLRVVPGQLATSDSFVGYGSAPALDATGSRVVVASYFALSVYDVDGTYVATSEEFVDDDQTEGDQPSSVAWIDSDRFVALANNLTGDIFSLGVYTVAGDTITTDMVVELGPRDASLTAYPSLAGVDSSRILVNGLAGATLQAFDVATLTPSPAADVQLPAPALSAWVDGGTLWVDEQRALHVDDTVVGGEYLWARR